MLESFGGILVGRARRGLLAVELLVRDPRGGDPDRQGRTARKRPGASTPRPRSRRWRRRWPRSRRTPSCPPRRRRWLEPTCSRATARSNATYRGMTKIDAAVSETADEDASAREAQPGDLRDHRADRGDRLAVEPALAQRGHRGGPRGRRGPRFRRRGRGDPPSGRPLDRGDARRDHASSRASSTRRGPCSPRWRTAWPWSRTAATSPRRPSSSLQEIQALVERSATLSSQISSASRRAGRGDADGRPGDADDLERDPRVGRRGERDATGRQRPRRPWPSTSTRPCAASGSTSRRPASARRSRHAAAAHSLLHRVPCECRATRGAGVRL